MINIDLSMNFIHILSIGKNFNCLNNYYEAKEYISYEYRKKTMLDRTTLEIIYFISKKGSLTEAAKELHVNQST